MSVSPHPLADTLGNLHKCLLNEWKNHKSEKQSLLKNIKIVVASDGSRNWHSFLLSFGFGSFNVAFTLFEINH